MNRFDHGLGVIGLAILATVLAVFLSVGVPILTAKEGVKLSDWLGFAGNVLGSGTGLLAAAIAWRAVQKQIATQREQISLEVMIREEDRIEARLASLNGCIEYLENVALTLSRKKPEEMPRLYENWRKGILSIDRSHQRRTIAAAIGGTVNDIDVRRTANLLGALGESAKLVQDTYSHAQYFLYWREKFGDLDDYDESVREAKHAEALLALGKAIENIDKQISNLNFGAARLYVTTMQHRARIEAKLYDSIDGFTRDPWQGI